MPRILHFAIITSLCLTLGCNRQSISSNNSQPSGAAGSLDPCSLLTNAEVAAALQATAVESQRDGSSHCIYRAKDGFNALIIEAARQGADSVFAGLRTANAMMGGSEKTLKIGDESLSWAMGQEFSARKGEAYVTIDMRGVTKGQTGIIGPQLAAKAIARL